MLSVGGQHGHALSLVVFCKTGFGSGHPNLLYLDCCTLCNIKIGTMLVSFLSHVHLLVHVLALFYNVNGMYGYCLSIIVDQCLSPW